MIGDGSYVITNAHVVETPDDALAARVFFFLEDQAAVPVQITPASTASAPTAPATAVAAAQEIVDGDLPDQPPPTPPSSPSPPAPASQRPGAFAARLDPSSFFISSPPARFTLPDRAHLDYTVVRLRAFDTPGSEEERAWQARVRAVRPLALAAEPLAAAAYSPEDCAAAAKQADPAVRAAFLHIAAPSAVAAPTAVAASAPVSPAPAAPAAASPVPGVFAEAADASQAAGVADGQTPVSPQVCSPPTSPSSSSFSSSSSQQQQQRRSLAARELAPVSVFVLQHPRAGPKVVHEGVLLRQAQLCVRYRAETFYGSSGMRALLPPDCSVCYQSVTSNCHAFPHGLGLPYPLRRRPRAGRDRPRRRAAPQNR